MRRFGNWLAFLILVSALAASSLPREKTGSQLRQKPEDKYPSSLAREIYHQLLVLPFYSVFDSITFSLEGKKVTLAGQVVRHTLKDHAGDAVKNIEGVDTVVNNIEVLPASPADDDLRRFVYRAIYEDPALARYAVQAIPSIHIIVKNGNVSLEGSVSAVSDKNLAALRAGTVPNVLGVKNNLVVQPKGGAAE
jgi:hyperosmotically inducible periplasmic protein